METTQNIKNKKVIISPEKIRYSLLKCEIFKSVDILGKLYK